MKRTDPDKFLYVLTWSLAILVISALIIGAVRNFYVFYKNQTNQVFVLMDK